MDLDAAKDATVFILCVVGITVAAIALMAAALFLLPTWAYFTVCFGGVIVAAWIVMYRQIARSNRRGF